MGMTFAQPLAKMPAQELLFEISKMTLQHNSLWASCPRYTNWRMMSRGGQHCIWSALWHTEKDGLERNTC